MKIPLLFAPIILIATVCLPLCAADVNILEEGDFEATEKGMPAGFDYAGFAGDPSITPNRFALVTEESQFVRITVPSGTGKEVANIKLREPIPAPKDWVTLNISVKLRVRDYLQGAEGWHGVKVFVQFFDSEGAPIGSEVPAISIKENVEQWTKFEKEIEIPPGTESFTLSAGMLGSSGEVDIDDLLVVPVK